MNADIPQHPDDAASAATVDGRKLRPGQIAAAAAAIGISLGMYAVPSQAAFDSYSVHPAAQGQPHAPAPNPQNSVNGQHSAPSPGGTG